MAPSWLVPNIGPWVLQQLQLQLLPLTMTSSFDLSNNFMRPVDSQNPPIHPQMSFSLGQQFPSNHLAHGVPHPNQSIAHLHQAPVHQTHSMANPKHTGPPFPRMNRSLSHAQSNDESSLYAPLSIETLKIIDHHHGDGTEGYTDADADAGADGDGDGDADADGDGDADSSDDVIPTAIVIKNIPFAVKKEQLLDIMTKLALPLPYAFNYHFDSGVFRGLAFANFALADETHQVVSALNGRDIGGRKLRVEYKKMLPLHQRERIERQKREKRGQLEEQHRLSLNVLLALMNSVPPAKVDSPMLMSVPVPALGSTAISTPTFPPALSSSLAPGRSWLAPATSGHLPPAINFNDRDTLDAYTQLVVFRDDPSRRATELVVAPQSFSGPMRKTILALAAYLSLVEHCEGSFTILRRRLDHDAGLHLMVNLTQAAGLALATAAPGSPAPVHPQLMRSQLQLAIPLVLPLAGTLTLALILGQRLRQAPSPALGRPFASSAYGFPRTESPLDRENMRFQPFAHATPFAAAKDPNAHNHDGLWGNTNR